MQVIVVTILFSAFPGCSHSQGRDGHYGHALCSCVGVGSNAGQHHHERGGVHFLCVNLGSQCFQCFGSAFNEAVAPEFHFNKSVFSISEVHDGVTFQAVFVAIVIDLSVQCICIDSQVSDCYSFFIPSFGCFSFLHLAVFFNAWDSYLLLPKREGLQFLWVRC